MTWQTPETFNFEGHTIRWGAVGDGVPLILMHGTPFWSYEWSRLAPLLATERKVYFYDMLGYGNSDRPDADVSLGIQNRLFAALVGHWKVERPDVVAHDFGGATALRAHLIDGVDYNSLTLIDPVAVRPWGSPLVQHVKHHEAAFAGMPGYMHEAILPAYLQSAMKKTATVETLAPYAEQWTGAEKQASFYRQIAQMDQRYTDEVQDQYSMIRCPTQILWGEDDEWIPIERGQELHNLIPGSRFVTVPGAGHLMQEDAPEAIVHFVQSFLKSEGRT
ncbi:alpha/beta hydrolase [Labrenzia sp. R4_1]|uniref:alpha/beta fold hydrolase n=1 Tax=Stappiaceae TaxID=2821832 RepID=UPI001AD982C0|nr:alpha/beta hydrolase [Labrenzia sp. R4_1]MBO9427177.1 alpha/beta hydrolase [Labrenzia sp. R4_1]